MASKMVESMKFVPAQVIVFCTHSQSILSVFFILLNIFILLSLGSHLWRKGTDSVLRHYAKLYRFQGLAIVSACSFVLLSMFWFIKIFSTSTDFVCRDWILTGWYWQWIQEIHSRERSWWWYLQWEWSCSIPHSRAWSWKYASHTSWPCMCHFPILRSFETFMASNILSIYFNRLLHHWAPHTVTYYIMILPSLLGLGI